MSSETGKAVGRASPPWKPKQQRTWDVGAGTTGANRLFLTALTTALLVAASLFLTGHILPHNELQLSSSSWLLVAGVQLHLYQFISDDSIASLRW